MKLRPSSARTEPKQQALTRLVLGVFRVHGSLLAMGDRLVAPLGLSSARWQVLGAIELAARPLTVPTIARTMGISRQGVQKQVALLSEEGLVEQEENPAHRASPLIALTSAGRSAYRGADQQWRRRAETLAQDFSLDELENTRKVLEALDGLLRREKTNE